MKKYLSLVVSGIMLVGCASSSHNLVNNEFEDAAPTEEFELEKVSANNSMDIPQEENLNNDGSAEYFYKLGVKYEEGKGVVVDIFKAEGFYKQAMEKGSIDAINALGVIYLGHGDYDQAKKYFEIAAEKNDEIANFNLGNLTFIGGDGGVNLKALEYYKKSALKNYSPAYVALGDMYAMGKGIDPDVTKAESYYLKAADLNDDVAIDRLALLYLLQDGMDVEQDDTANSIKTVKLFQRVADKGNPKAMYVLSLLYQNGFYVKADYEKSIEYLKKSAALNYPEAEYSLAYLYLAGMYVEKDYAKGVELMTSAANHGFADAQNNIGMLLLKGEIVKKDLNQARSWLTKAVANGSAMANYNLGVVYDAGLGVSIDSNKAGGLYRKSAELGYLPAYAKVIDMYATGSKGVAKNNEVAREWLDKAIEQDDSDAMLLKANAYHYGNYGYAKDMAKAKTWLEKARELSNPNVSKVEEAWKRSERYSKFSSMKN